MIEDIDRLAKATKVSFNCQRCKGYWEKQLKYWADIGETVEMHLYCPACSPYRVGRDW